MSPSNRIGSQSLTTFRPRQEHARVNEWYDVVAWNGLIIGAVRYGFHDGARWCFSFSLLDVAPGYGNPTDEYGWFVLGHGEPPWTMPTVNRPQAASLAPEDLRQLPRADRLLTHEKASG